MFEINRWHTIIAALWCSLGCGYAYTFGTFSPALKKQYHLSNDDTSTIGIATTVIGLITWTAGLYTDRVGPQVAIATGALINTFSWLLYAIIATNDLEPISPTIMFLILGCLATYGAAMCTGGVFKVVTNNFIGEERGIAVGIAKAWVGVTSGFASTIYVGIWPSLDNSPERLNYLYYLAVSIMIFVLLPTPLMRVLGPAAGKDGLCFPLKLRFPFLQCVTLGLIVLTVVIAVLGNAVSNQDLLIFSIFLLSLALVPWLVLLPGSGASAEGMDAPLEAHEAPEAPAAVTALRQSPWASGPLQMMMRLDAWLLWINVLAIQAGGLLLTTNFGSIADSRTGVHVKSSSVVAIFSACNALGRLTGGIFSDRIVRARVARLWYLTFLTACQAAAMAVLCIPGPAAFYMGSGLSGYAFGSVFPVMIISIAELFGTERIASNYMVFDGTPGAIASLFIAKFFSQWVYDSHPSGLDGNCYGDDCYTLTYIAVMCLEVVACAAAVLLAMRSRVVYVESVWPALHESEGLSLET